jgi:hypothetical protein
MDTAAAPASPMSHVHSGHDTAVSAKQTRIKEMDIADMNKSFLYINPAATGMRQTLALILCMTVMPFLQGFAQHGDAWSLLHSIQKEYDRVNDYSAAVSVHLSIPGFSVPDMNVTVYFRKPDNFHVESDGFAMVPRDVLHFHPSMFQPGDYDIVDRGTRELRGVPCRVISLLASSDTARLQRATLMIDAAKKRILRLEADPLRAAPATADFTYTVVDGHNVPASITIKMEAPSMMRRMGAAPGTKQNTQGEKAVITLTYSKYRINKGIADDVFRKTIKSK